MKYNISLKVPLWAMLLCLLFSCSRKPDGPPPPYKKYRKGKFFCYFQRDDKKIKYLIIRTDSTQTEIDRRTGEKSFLSIHWPDSSHYELRYQYSVPELTREEEEQRRKSVLKTEIISGTDEYYVFESAMEDNDYTMNDTVWLKKHELYQ
jgi:hypothetical protein